MAGAAGRTALPKRRTRAPADEEGIGYDIWRAERLFALVPAQAFVAEWLSSFKEFPPRQKAASFGIDQVMEKLTSNVPGSN